MRSRPGLGLGLELGIGLVGLEFRLGQGLGVDCRHDGYAVLLVVCNFCSLFAC